MIKVSGTEKTTGGLITAQRLLTLPAETTEAVIIARTSVFTTAKEGKRQSDTAMKNINILKEDIKLKEKVTLVLSLCLVLVMAGCSKVENTYTDISSDTSSLESADTLQGYDESSNAEDASSDAEDTEDTENSDSSSDTVDGDPEPTTISSADEFVDYMESIGAAVNAEEADCVSYFAAYGHYSILYDEFDTEDEALEQFRSDRESAREYTGEEGETTSKGDLKYFRVSNDDLCYVLILNGNQYILSTTYADLADGLEDVLSLIGY